MSYLRRDEENICHHYAIATVTSSAVSLLAAGLLVGSYAVHNEVKNGLAITVAVNVIGMVIIPRSYCEETFSGLLVGTGDFHE